VKRCGSELASVGLDTWGVDFALLDRQGGLVGNPYHYRDSRTDGMVEEACRRVPREEIFTQTGIQFMQLNTLIQLFAMVEQRSPLLDVADRLLMMPDLLNYFLSGERVSEYTDASTSQCMDMRTGEWATGLLGRLGIPTHIFPPVIQPGTVLGRCCPLWRRRPAREASPWSRRAPTTPAPLSPPCRPKVMTTPTSARAPGPSSASKAGRR